MDLREELERLYQDGRFMDLLVKSEECFFKTNALECLYYLLLALVYYGDIKMAYVRLKQFLKRGGNLNNENIANISANVCTLSLDVNMLKGLEPYMDDATKMNVILQVWGDVHKVKKMLESSQIGEFERDYITVKISRISAQPINLDIGYFRKKFSGKLSRVEILTGEFEIFMYKIFSGEIDVIKDINPFIKELGEHRLIKIASLLQLYISLLKQDYPYICLMEQAFENMGDNYAWFIARIFRSFLEGRDLLGDTSIPEEYKILKTNYLLMRKYLYNEDFRSPELKGFKHFWWLVNKAVKNDLWVNFSGKISLRRGMEKVLPLYRNRKILIGYAFVKVFKSMDAVERFAHVIFPKSKNVRKRVWELKSRLLPILQIPNNINMSKDYGNFLRDETDIWARILREAVFK